MQPPDLLTLEARLRARATDDERAIERRLTGARRELELATSYDVHVINDDLERAVGDPRRDPDSKRLWSEKQP